MAISNCTHPDPTALTNRLDPYFFKYLPGYFKANDTYVVGSKGILERYLDVFQMFSEQYLEDLEDLSTLPFPDTTEEKFLVFIAEFLGSPPDTFGSLSYYSDLLRNIVQINKVRGTAMAIRNFFRVMGTDAEITTVLAEYYLHDDSNAHDDADVHHDGYCHPCVSVSINVLDPIHIITQLNVSTLTTDTRKIVQSILVYFLPINSVFKTFKYNGVTKDITLDNSLIPMLVPGGPLPS